jgi:hypothetical protein
MEQHVFYLLMIIEGATEKASPISNSFVEKWRHDTQHNDIQHYDIQHNDIHHNGIPYNDT